MDLFKQKKGTSTKPFHKQNIIHKKQHWYIVLGVFVVLLIAAIAVHVYIFLALRNNTLFIDRTPVREPITSLRQQQLIDRVDRIKSDSTRYDATFNKKESIVDPALF